MPDRRIGPWSTAASSAGAPGLPPSAVLAGFIASQTKSSPWHQPVFVLLASIAATAFLLLITVGVVALVGG